MDIKQIQKTLSIRIFVLALFIVLVNAWLVANTGSDIKQFAIVNIIILTFAVSGSIIKYFSKSEQNIAENNFRVGLLSILQTPVLISLWSVFIISCLFVSSVTLQTSTNASSCTATIYKVPSKSGSFQTPPVSEYVFNSPKPVLVNPFGSVFTLKIKGFQDYNFEVHPIVPQRIYLEKDLTVTPSIFIRLTDYILLHREVFLLDISSKGENIYKGLVGNKGAFLLGTKQNIPTEFLERWKLELMSRDDILGNTEIYKRLKEWTLDTMYINTILSPLDTLNVKIFNSDDSIVKDYYYLIGFDLIQDIMIK